VSSLDKGLIDFVEFSLTNTTEKQKAENETSMPPAKPRELGKVRASAGAEAEWTRELRTERVFSE